MYGHQSQIAVQSECTLWIFSESSCNYFRLLIFLLCMYNSMGGRDFKKIRKNATHDLYLIISTISFVFCNYNFSAHYFFDVFPRCAVIMGFRLFCLWVIFFFLRYYNFRFILFSVQCVKVFVPICNLNWEFNIHSGSFYHCLLW